MCNEPLYIIYKKNTISVPQVESGGTVLSTNWSEVGQGKVERKPPDGMEWKTWNS